MEKGEAIQYLQLVSRSKAYCEVSSTAVLDRFLACLQDADFASPCQKPASWLMGIKLRHGKDVLCRVVCMYDVCMYAYTFVCPAALNLEPKKAMQTSLVIGHDARGTRGEKGGGGV